MKRGRCMYVTKMIFVFPQVWIMMSISRLVFYSTSCILNAHALLVWCRHNEIIFRYIFLLFFFFLILSINVFELTDFEYLPDPASCPNYCGRVFRGMYRKIYLKNHLKIECNIAPMFSCGICSRKFSRNDNLKRHLVLVHKTLENPGVADDGNGELDTYSWR